MKNSFRFFTGLNPQHLVHHGTNAKTYMQYLRVPKNPLEFGFRTHRASNHRSPEIQFLDVIE